MKEVTEHEAQVKLAALCSKAEHCSQEALDKMRQWGIDDEAQARVMAYLVSNKYIDDARFCKFFVNDKIKYNKWGRRKVEQALYAKRIPKSISDPIFDDISDDEYVSILRPLIKNKSRQVKASNEYEAKMKLIKYALGRGFDMNIIRQCVDDAEDYGDD